MGGYKIGRGGPNWPKMTKHRQTLTQNGQNDQNDQKRPFCLSSRQLHGCGGLHQTRISFKLCKFPSRLNPSPIPHRLRPVSSSCLQQPVSSSCLQEPVSSSCLQQPFRAEVCTEICTEICNPRRDKINRVLFIFNK